MLTQDSLDPSIFGEAAVYAIRGDGDAITFGSRLSDVCTMLKRTLVMPATNASSERSFSALRRVKSYLRSTMRQDRLNHLIVLHIHDKHTDELDLKEVANKFVRECEHRLRTFGKF